MMRVGAMRPVAPDETPCPSPWLTKPYGFTRRRMTAPAHKQMSISVLSRAPRLVEAPADSAGAPAHVAIIMDGNGRWASRRGLPKVAGHREGARAVRRTIEAAIRRGVG